MRWLIPLLIAALVAAACSVEDDITLPDPLPTADDGIGEGPEPTVVPDIIEGNPVPQDPGVVPTPPVQPTPIPEPDGRAEIPEDFVLAEGERLVVQSTDGQLFTMLRTGENVLPLTNPTEGTVHSAPTWTPDSSRIAWVSANPNGTRPQLRTARIDGSAWFEYDTEVPPFFMAWDPTSTQVAMLSAGDLGFNMSVIDVGLGIEQRTIDSGSPFWFSWSLDADSMLVHASGIRLDLVPVDGPAQVIEAVPGTFQAPRWIDSQQPLLYADRIDDEQFLVNAGPLGVGRRPLISYDGYLQFAVAPVTGTIALQVVDEGLAPVPEVITASTDVAPNTQRQQGDEEFVDVVDPVERDQLILMQLFGGDPWEIESSRPAAAFYWNQDGTKLAYLLTVDTGDGDCASGAASYRLVIFDAIEQEYSESQPFHPSATFACDYLPFFDQDSQAHAYWSADGVNFVLSGTLSGSGESGIFMAETNLGTLEIDLTLVANGEFASFAPFSGAAGSDCVGVECDA